MSERPVPPAKPPKPTSPVPPPGLPPKETPSSASGGGFKAKLLTKKQGLLVKIGAVEETVDPEFEDVKSIMLAYEKRITQLQADVKTYLTAVRTVAAASRKMLDSLVDFVEPDTRMRLTVLKCNSGQDAMDRQVAETIDSAILQSLDGFALFFQKFADYNKRMKDRQSKLLDYDRLQKTVTNLKAKPPADATKLPAAREKLERAREAYERCNEELISDMRHFLKTKWEFLNPHVRDLCFAHTEFFTAYASELAEAYKYCPEPEDL